jgi:cytochrome d ubiquinol oxidase subunit I
MIGVVVAMFAIYLLVRWLKPKWLSGELFLLPYIVIGFFGIVIVELGWMLTEIGRQPWAVTGYVTTEQAVTKTNNITSFGYIFPAAFVLLLIVTIMAIRKIVKDGTLLPSKGAKK